MLTAFLATGVANAPAALAAPQAQTYRIGLWVDIEPTGPAWAAER